MVIKATLTTDGLFIPNTELTQKQQKKIKRVLTIRCKQFSGWIKRTCAYTCDNDGITIPRFAPLILEEFEFEIKNILHRGRQAATLNKFDATLSPNQQQVLTSLMENEFSDDMKSGGLAGAIVNMPPGEGKTFLAMAVLNLLGRKSCVIVPNTLVFKQWKDACTQFFPDATIGEYYGKKKLDGDIIIMIVNSAQGDSFTLKGGRTFTSIEWWKRFGIVVYDEVHMYCSDARAQVFRSAQAQYVLGLSATPDQRLDNLSVLAQWHIGPVIDAVKLPTFAAAQVTYNTDVRIVRYKCETKYAEVGMSDSGTVSVPRTVNLMVEDPDRNQVIIDEAIRLYGKGLCIFVFTDRRGHAQRITQLLREMKYTPLQSIIDIPQLPANIRGIVYDFLYPEPINVTTMLGGASDEIIHEAKTASRIITTTYQYSSTGVSINKLNATILATPRKNNMTQILGRIYRLAGDPSITRHIVDILDWYSPLRKQHYERRKIYMTKFKANIETTEVKSIESEK